MRVLVTADAVGGVWTYALHLAAGLAADGDEVVLAVLGPPPSCDQRTAAREAGVELVVTALPLDWTAAGEPELDHAARGLAELASARRSQLVHLSSPALAGAHRFPMPVVGVAHSCLATWWEALRDGPPPADFSWRIAATARGYRACDALIAPSAAFAAATERAYGVRPRVVHNGGEAADLPAAPRDTPVATAGRLWDEAKGAVTLDAAARRLSTPILALGSTSPPGGEPVALPGLRLAGVLPAADVAADARADPRVRLRRLLRALWPGGAGGGAGGLRPGAERHPHLPRAVGGRGGLRPAGRGRGLRHRSGGAARRRRGGRAAGRAAARQRAERYDLARCVDATRAVHHAVVRPHALAGAAA